MPFDLCMATDEYPDILKRNNVIPVYKQKGDRNNVESDRGIAIQPIIDKMFERLVKKCPQPHLKKEYDL